MNLEFKSEIRICKIREKPKFRKQKVEDEDEDYRLHGADFNPAWLELLAPAILNDGGHRQSK